MPWYRIVCHNTFSAKVDLLRVHVMWRNYFKWSPKHRDMQLVSNFSDPALCYSKRMLHNTRLPGTEVLGINTGPNLISLNQGPRSASEHPGFSVLSCMCPMSGTKPHELSSLHPSPSHPCFHFCKTVPKSEWSKEQDPEVPQRQPSFPLGTVICMSA